MKQNEQTAFEKSAGRLDVFFNVMEKLALVLCIVFFVAAGVFLFKGSVTDGDAGPNAVDLGWVKLSLDPTFAAGKLTVDRMLALSCPVLLIVTITFYAGFRLIRGILKPMKQGRPFEKEVSVNLKRLGILVLTGGVLLNAAGFIVMATIFREFEIGKLFDSQAVSGYTIEYIVRPDFIVFALLLFLLSYVFRYGEKLQTESDETL